MPSEPLRRALLLATLLGTAAVAHADEPGQAPAFARSRESRAAHGFRPPRLRREGPRLMTCCGEASALGVEGEGVARLRIDEEGRVSSVEIVREAGHDFDDAMRTWLLQLTFDPATRDGSPVRGTVDWTYTFRLGPPLCGYLLYHDDKLWQAVHPPGGCARQLAARDDDGNGPDCSAPDGSPARGALVQLASAGLVDAARIDAARTVVRQLSSEKVASNVFRQIHRVRFEQRDGSRIEVLAVSYASRTECAADVVEVFVEVQHHE